MSRRKPVILPPIVIYMDRPCKNNQAYVHPVDASCLRCGADQGVACRDTIEAEVLRIMAETAMEPHPGLAPCPHCFESSGYIWEHGNDWESGPWSNQTNIPCSHCHGTGSVEAEPITLDDLEEIDAQGRIEFQAKDEMK